MDPDAGPGTARNAQIAQLLLQEHRLFRTLLDAMQALILRSHAVDRIQPGFFGEAAEFYGRFVEGYRHQKEEELLAHAVSEGDGPHRSGTMAVVLAEHERVQRMTFAMRAAAQDWQRGRAVSRFEAIQHAQDYVRLLRGHFEVEERVLFPLASQFIPTEQLDRQAEAFLEHVHQHASERERALQMVVELERQARA